MKLYTRRDMARLASIGVAGIATGGLAVEFPSSVSSRARGLLGLRAINWRAIGGGMDYKKLAEDLEKLMTKTLVTVDWPFAINLNYYGAAGARPFYGQNMLKVVKLPNMVLSKAESGYGNNYLDGTAALEELWLESLQAFPNSFTSSGVLRYVYAPSFVWGKNFFNNTRATGAVFDMGQSRTCAEFLAAMPTSFENLANVWKGWTFRCSDGDIKWDGAAWAKV